MRNPILRSRKNRGSLSETSPAILALLGGLALGLGGQATVRAAESNLERSMAFIERSTEATELFGSAKFQDALPIFEELMARSADLDTDGYVAISLADCLAALGRTAEAQQAYSQAASDHPDRREEIEGKRIDLELTGPISPELIDRLRQAIAVQENPKAFQWQLGWALQKRAHSLLLESIHALEDAFEAISPGRTEGLLSLRELTDQLGTRVDELERLRRFGPGMARHTTETCQTSPRTAHLSCVIPADDDGSETALELSLDKSETAEEWQLVANGRAIELDKTRQRLIRIHLERINALLLESMAGQSTDEREHK